MKRRVLTLEAEIAMNRINQTLALHAAGKQGRIETRRRRLRGTAGVVRADPSRYLVLPHIVAIAEEFSRRLLIAKTVAEIPQDRPVLQYLWLKAEGQAEGRWEDHLKAWKDWHQFPLASKSIYLDLRPFIEARNAIMHGLGELTKRQQRGNQEATLRGALKQVGIDVVGTRLIVHNKAVARCARACRTFVHELDLEAQHIS